MSSLSELLINQELSDSGTSYNSNTVTCPHCHSKYRQETESQLPGFRDRDYNICPYCHKENGSSMSVEYHNYPLA